MNQEPFRILHVVGAMNRGGTETMIMNIYRKIDRSKVQFDFVVHTDEKCDYDDEIEELGGNIYRINKFNGLNFIQYYNKWLTFFRLNKDYKIVHGHIGSSAAIYLYIASKHNCFTIAHSHAVSGKGIGNFIYNVFSYPTRYIAKYFFACSNQAGIDRFGKKVTNSSNFSVLNNAIDSEKFIFNENIRYLKRTEFNIQDEFVIGHIGRFDENKNHSFIVDVFKYINDKYEKSRLILVGDGKLRSNIERKITDLNLKDKVIFTGVRSDINELLQAMDTFIFPSYFEGLGIVAIEAQSAALKTICSETIPKETRITDYIEYVSLSKPVELWGEHILKFKNGYSRENMKSNIIESGYDINQKVIWVQEFYLKAYNEIMGVIR